MGFITLFFFDEKKLWQVVLGAEWINIYHLYTSLHEYSIAMIFKIHDKKHTENNNECMFCNKFEWFFLAQNSFWFIEIYAIWDFLFCGVIFNKPMSRALYYLQDIDETGKKMHTIPFLMYTNGMDFREVNLFILFVLVSNSKTLSCFVDIDRCMVRMRLS